jgi:F0F1-type ATP synthase assembly protein I
MARPDPSMRGDLPRKAGQRRDAWNGLDQSSIMSVELLAGILTWGGLGWLADRWLGTGGWLLGLGVLLGFGLGLYLVRLRADKIDAEEAAAAQREG